MFNGNAGKRTLWSVIILSGIFAILAIAQITSGWGNWGHKHIDRAAVFALPEPMRTFFYNHIDYITESSVTPDLRRPLLNDKAEVPRHFIDVEDFNIPLQEFPKTSREASARFDSSFLATAGILPWYIQDMTEKLTRSFKSKNKSDILFLSSELAHYIGDAHMPLHTSSNYNGQLTGQDGIHALWESVLPPMFGNDFNFRTESPKYISDITDYTWQMIAQSHSLVKDVLQADLIVRKQFDTSNIYKRDQAGNLVLRYGNPMYSDAYARAFQKQLGNMVEDQLRLSIYDITCYWYTAWVNAGKPDLTGLDSPHLTKQNKKNFKQEYRAWMKGKLLNLDW